MIALSRLSLGCCDELFAALPRPSEVIMNHDPGSIWSGTCDFGQSAAVWSCILWNRKGQLPDEATWWQVRIEIKLAVTFQRPRRCRVQRCRQELDAGRLHCTHSGCHGIELGRALESVAYCGEHGLYESAYVGQIADSRWRR